jgi:hypothetical protein
LIGHLVRYNSTNIFRIWLPIKNEVICTRDIVFEPTKFFDGPQVYAHGSVIEEVVKRYTQDESCSFVVYRSGEPMRLLLPNNKQVERSVNKDGMETWGNQQSAVQTGGEATPADRSY